MLARAELPPSYRAWNEQWGAPIGQHRWLRKLTRPSWRTLAPIAQLFGPFAYQPNNSIRAFEYPWAYEAVAPKPGQRVVDVGGGLAGFQFTLARAGAKVFNVDPGKQARGRGWPIDQHTIALLNRGFGTDVTLKQCFLQDVDLEDGTIDTIVSISVLEHIPDPDLDSLMQRAHKLLKPGGRFVITTDLFLDLAPFSTKTSNEWGKNVSIREMIERSGLSLASGDRAELYGFAEFDAKAIQANAPRYLVGEGHPALAQLFVLQKT